MNVKCLPPSENAKKRRAESKRHTFPAEKKNTAEKAKSDCQAAEMERDAGDILTFSRASRIPCDSN